MAIWIISLLVVFVIMGAITLNHIMTSKMFDWNEKIIGGTGVAIFTYLLIFSILNEIL
jgi:hypothetical protein